MIAPERAAADTSLHVERDAQRVRVGTAYFELTCHLKTGLWDAQWLSGSNFRPAIRGADCAVKLADGTPLAASDYTHHTCTASDVTRFKDAFGSGTQAVITHSAPGKPELRQIFRIYPDRPYFLVRLEISSEQPAATNDIAPIAIDGTKMAGAAVDLGVGEKPRTLSVPYDNDAFVRYSSDYPTSSYEVTAVYDNADRHGFVLGSVTHDLWKTGIAMGGFAPHLLASLRIYGGATGTGTQDTQPHGMVQGKIIASPMIFVGYFSDWRDGMEAYGRANAKVSPSLAWSGSAPVGWNSWAAYMTSVSSANYLNAADFVKDSLEPTAPNVWKDAFINLDSFWDNLSDSQIAAAVRHVHANRQRAGIYWTPFVYWGNNLSQKVEGTDGRYTYGDIVMKDAAGKPLPKLDGGLPLDPTHPGTLERIDWECSRFVAWGFDFVKLDFLTHGALECAHFNPRITTGTAAYNMGMARIDADLSPARIGRPFFISLSIAPLFPAGYGHSRRISCDTFGAISNSEYMLNSLTYGWWEGGTIYAFNDGDHAVLYQAHGQSVTTENEGLSRLNANVVAGSPILDSDDLLDPKAQARVKRLLGNPEVMALAKEGKTFRPVEGDTGQHASDTFVRDDRASGKFYIAVFNYSPTAAVTKNIDLSRLGLKSSTHYKVYNLWTKQTSQAEGSLSLTLEPAESALLCLTRKG
jgi:hypothetical protein